MTLLPQMNFATTDVPCHCKWTLLPQMNPVTNVALSLQMNHVAHKWALWWMYPVTVINEPCHDMYPVTANEPVAMKWTLSQMYPVTVIIEPCHKCALSLQMSHVASNEPCHKCTLSPVTVNEPCCHQMSPVRNVPCHCKWAMLSSNEPCHKCTPSLLPHNVPCYHKWALSWNVPCCHKWTLSQMYPVTANEPCHKCTLSLQMNLLS